MSPMRKRLSLLLCLALAGLSAPLHAVRQPVRAKHGMVVAMEATAADVGVAVLQKGGNAVDAAVAVGFALAVTHPFAGNLGGGGFMLIRMADGRSTFIDFRERAPEKASRNMYLDAKGELTKDSIEGWRSSGVPGTVRGFEMAVKKYGKRTWAENLAPAVELASKGFPVSYALAEGLEGIAQPGELAGVEAHLPAQRRVLRDRRDAGAAGAGADARADLRRTAPTSSTKARPRSASPRRWRRTAASSRWPTSRATRRSSARR